MANELIESMARALHTNDWRYDGQVFDYCPLRVKGMFRSDAQAALQALHDHGPTEAMVEAGERAVVEGKWINNSALQTGFTAMLAAALKEITDGQ